MPEKNSQSREPRPEGAEAGKSPDRRDMTERKPAEAALARSSERTWQTLDNMMEGCMVIAFDWTYLYVNDVAARQALQKRENLIGRTMLEMYPGVEQSDVFARYRRTMQERINQRFEQFYTFADGTTKWYSFSVEPVPEGIFVLTLETTEQKRSELALQQARDTLDARVAERTRELDGANARLTSELAERKQAEEALHQSEDRYRALFEQSPVAIAYAREGRTLYVNPAYLRMFGFSGDEELRGRLLTEQIAPHSRAEIAERARLRAQGTSAPSAYETVGSRRDGTEFPFFVELSQVILADGPATIAFFTDITERKQAEEAVRWHVEELRAANAELERFNRLAVDRELRMVELKQEVNDLLRKAGLSPKYGPEAEERERPT
jgi:PAS domain S-box-containing protein